MIDSQELDLGTKFLVIAPLASMPRLELPPTFECNVPKNFVDDMHAAAEKEVRPSKKLRQLEEAYTRNEGKKMKHADLKAV